MTKLIPLDSAIDTLTELSCDDNAHWGAIIDAIRAIPTIDPAAIREAALKEALQRIGNWPTPISIERMNGHEDAYRAVEAMIGEKK